MTNCPTTQPISDTDDIRMMRAALTEARAAAAEGEIPIGAVVVSPKGRIIGRGHNQTERLADVTAHAEMLAITAAEQALGGKYLPGCTLYVTVEPCPMCAGAIGWAQISRVVYGASDPKQGYSRLCAPGMTPLHPKTTVTAGVLAEECSALMKEFFTTLRH